MAAFTDTFIDESSSSAIFHPKDTISEIKIDGSFQGTVKLRASRPGAGVWSDVDEVTNQSTSTTHSQVIHTPDLAMDYKFEAFGVIGTANVYFGP